MSSCYLGSRAGSEEWKSLDLWMIPSGEGSNLPKCRFISVIDSRSSDCCCKIRYTLFGHRLFIAAAFVSVTMWKRRARIIYIVMRLYAWWAQKFRQVSWASRSDWILEEKFRVWPLQKTPDINVVDLLWTLLSTMLSLSMCNFKKEKWKSIQKIHVLRINSSSLYCRKRNTRGCNTWLLSWLLLRF